MKIAEANQHCISNSSVKKITISVIGGLFFSSLFWMDSASAAPKNAATRLAVSQGISSPAITSPVNFSHGYLYTNPAVASYFPSPFVSAEGASGNGSNDYGAELGIGNGTAGLAAGYIKNECCDDGRFGAMGGLASSSVAGGFGYHEDSTYSLGMIFQPKGTHRIGLAADVHGSGGDPASYGAGYSYHADSLIFALDASRRSGRGQIGGSSIMLTPGLELMASMVSLSISYDIYFYEGNRARNDQLWFGLGFGSQSVHIAVYHDYYNEWSAALSFWM